MAWTQENLGWGIKWLNPDTGMYFFADPNEAPEQLSLRQRWADVGGTDPGTGGWTAYHDQELAALEKIQEIRSATSDPMQKLHMMNEAGFGDAGRLSALVNTGELDPHTILTKPDGGQLTLGDMIAQGQDKNSSWENFVDWLPYAAAFVAGGMGVNALGASAAGSGALGGAGATTAEAAGAMGGAAGTAGGGLTAAEAAGLAGSAAAGPTAGAATGSEFTGGLTGTITGSPGLATGTVAGTGTSLAPGYFAGETLYPVMGGLTTGAATGATAAATGSALSRILDGAATGSDWLDLAGRAIPGVVGAFAADRQADALEDLTGQYMAMGAPSRSRYEASFTPGFTMAADPGYRDALDQTTKSFLHKASVGSGNPAESPNAWRQTLSDVNANFAYPALQEFRRLNANTGGLSRFAEAAPQTGLAAINAQGNVYNALGGAAADIFAPRRRRTLADLLREEGY